MSWYGYFVQELELGFNCQTCPNYSILTSIFKLILFGHFLTMKLFTQELTTAEVCAYGGFKTLNLLATIF